MTAAEIVRARLLQIAAVTALVGQRVRLLRFRQSETWPAVRVQQISDVESMHLRGSSGLHTARVQIDYCAGEASGVDPYASARAVDEAAHGPGNGTGLCGFQGLVPLGSPGIWVDAIRPAGYREDFDLDELRVVRIMRDYLVTWKAA